MSTQAVSKRTRNQIRRKKLFVQKLYGLALITMSIMLIYMASHGTSVDDRDATAVLLTAPLGLYLLFTKTVAIY